MFAKGKDIKVPFDCLWHCMTRSFKIEYGYNMFSQDKKPEGFDGW